MAAHVDWRAVPARSYNLITTWLYLTKRMYIQPPTINWFCHGINDSDGSNNLSDCNYDPPSPRHLYPEALNSSHPFWNRARPRIAIKKLQFQLFHPCHNRPPQLLRALPSISSHTPVLFYIYRAMAIGKCSGLVICIRRIKNMNIYGVFWIKSKFFHFYYENLI